MTWGSRKMSNGSTYYGPLEHIEYIDAFYNPTQWLNSEWSHGKQQAFNDLYNFNILGHAPFRTKFDTILDSRDDQLYLDRYDLDWPDVRDPRNLKQSRHSLSLSQLNFVSDNVKRLYR